jgi:hypothetical protein
MRPARFDASGKFRRVTSLPDVAWNFFAETKYNQLPCQDPNPAQTR